MLQAIEPPFRMGWVKVGIACLRRSSFAQAGRLFGVLTYWEYAPHVDSGRTLQDAVSTKGAPFGMSHAIRAQRDLARTKEMPSRVL